jgi:hypothetical protein
MAVYRCGRSVVTSLGVGDDPYIVTKVVAHHIRNKNLLRVSGWILYPAQVIRASCSQTLCSDLGSEPQRKQVDCLSSYCIAIKQGVRTELRESPLRFGPHSIIVVREWCHYYLRPPPPQKNVQRRGRSAVTFPKCVDDPHIINQSCCHLHGE